MSSSSSARISITSDEVNLLVYRYLLEAGFKHTAFVFHGESLLHRSPNLVQADMPPGSLVTLLQKALLFLYVETHVATDGTQIPCDEAFSLFKPHDHDHGAIDAPIQFEESHVDSLGTKRSESVNRDGEENNGRPSKKTKAVAKERNASFAESMPQQESPEAQDSEIRTQPIPKPEEMEIETPAEQDGGVKPEEIVNGADRVEFHADSSEGGPQS